MCRTMRCISLSTVAAAALLLAACATAPEATDTGPPPETVIAQALVETNPYDAEQSLTNLLARPSLTDAQRAEALYHRGSLRRQGADDRRGAVEDFKAMLALAPDSPLAPNATAELEFATKDVAAIEASMNRFLTLAQWFDGTWVLGDHELAVERYKKSGLAPTPEQVKTLREAGYICQTGTSESPLKQFAGDRDDLDGMDWCAEELTS
ncbi:MAG: hypothetical protein CMF04_10580 [Hyphomonas sp.]|nr:hypothetical protein [Hyphomonas sp.]|tara:strand:- start:7162 stop:7788 length:627 start_codon:yes stop_codon:yes gene_type:complete